jgi:hypothetical protein
MEQQMQQVQFLIYLVQLYENFLQLKLLQDLYPNLLEHLVKENVV